MGESMKKFLKSLVLIFIILPATFFLTACGTPTVVNIEKTNTTDNMVIYTIYYSDGKTSSITIENGKDGKSIDVEALYQLGVSKGFYTDDLNGYQKFLTDLMNNNENAITTNAGVSKALQSVVSVYAKFQTSSGSVFSSSANEVMGGSGVIYKMEAEYSYIITNYHVLYDNNASNSTKRADAVYIYQYGVDKTLTTSGNNYVFGGGAVECTYIDGSMNYDIAVLRAKTSDLVKHNANVRAGDVATGYSVSQDVYAIGNPQLEGLSVTKGVISVESETVKITAADETTEIGYRLLRMDTAINGGNSGGGLFDANGNLVGIVNAKLVYVDSENTPAEGISYAIPFDTATRVADNLMHYYDIQKTFTPVLRLTLGISYQSLNSKQVYDPLTGKVKIEDQIVVATAPSYGTIAFEMNLQKDEIVTAFTINDKTYQLSRSFDLGNLLLEVRAEDVIAISYIRDGVTYTTGAHNVLSTELNKIY